MALAFVPVLIRVLGTEAYGLIGLYITLQAWFALIDMGLRPAMLREMSRLSAGQRSADSAHDLLRSSEVFAGGLCAAAALGLLLASSWLAQHWLNVDSLPWQVAAQALAIMGVMAALQVLEGLYASALAGLERQVLQNLITASTATLRGAGGAALVVFVMPDLLVYFYWQLAVSVGSLIAMRLALRRAMPTRMRPACFSWAELNKLKHFAGGVATITVLVLLLTQLDKLVLAKLLPLAEFGQYMLASVVASTLFYLYGPIVAAFHPRMAVVAQTQGSEAALKQTYHLGAQLVTLFAGSAAVVLIAMAEPLLGLWTGNADLARDVAPLLAVLTLGALLNGLMAMPYHLQLAHGWTGLTVRLNSVAVCVLVATLLILVPKYGGMASAVVFVVLNAGYITVGVWLMHRRLLPSERVAWYLQDTLIPLLPMTMVGWIAHHLADQSRSQDAALLTTLLTAAAVVTVGTVAAPQVRRKLVAWLLSRHPSAA